MVWGEYHLVSLRGQLNKLNTLNEIPSTCYIYSVHVFYRYKIQQSLPSRCYCLVCIREFYCVFNGAKIHINYSSAVEKTTSDQALN